MKRLLILIFLVVMISCKSESEAKYITVTPNDGKSYEEVQADESLTKDNWECTGDCSGHKAGYSWAEEKGITDPEDCSGKSASFIEGCEAYANEH